MGLEWKAPSSSDILQLWGFHSAKLEEELEYIKFYLHANEQGCKF